MPDAPYPTGAGAFEIKARATGLQIDADAFDGFAADGAAESALELAGGATWWVGRTARWMVDMHHTRFEAPAGTGDISPENAIITTLQVGL